MSSINDRNDWKVVRKALTVIGFNEDEVEVKTQPACLGLHQCIVGSVTSALRRPYLGVSCCSFDGYSILENGEFLGSCDS